MFKLILLFTFTFNINANELEEITALLKTVHGSCSEFVLLSDRLLCYRRVKMKHRDLLVKYFQKLEKEKNIPEIELKQFKKSILSQIETVY